jgi:hypothetical protein
MRAGFFEQDVTPPVGVYLAGYPSRREPSEGIDDPLYMRIMVLEDDTGARLALVTADLLKFPRDMAWRTKLWAERTLGLPGAALIINLSHTHSAPGLFPQACYPHWPVDNEYICRVEQTLREGLAAALADLQPVTLRYGCHQAHFGVSRRLPVAEDPGRVRLGLYPEGYYDPDLPVLVCSRPGETTPRAVLYSYACHATSKSSLNLSADWPGQVSQGLKRELGEGVMTLFAQGAAGSVMTRVSYSAGAEQYTAYWAGVAQDLANFIRSDKMQDLTLRLRVAETEFVLPYDFRRLPSTGDLLALADPLDTPLPDAYHPANRSIVRLWARDVLERQRTGTLSPGFRMHLTKVGLAEGLQLLALSGEVTAQVGRAAKALFPDLETLFLGYCSYTDAYIPTAAMLPEGGHEALCSIYFHERPAPFTPDIDERLAAEIRGLKLPE